MAEPMHPAPPGPPGPPSHTHEDGTVCHFEEIHTMRWWSQQEAWPHKPVPCPGFSTKSEPETDPIEEYLARIEQVISKLDTGLEEGWADFRAHIELLRSVQ